MANMNSLVVLHRRSLDLLPEPDLHPLYPSIAYIAPLLSSHSGLTPAQKAELIAHCVARACVFGDLSILSYLISDPQAQAYVDLGIRDEDGLGLVSLIIHGFGAESDRDVEREECVRLLVSQGADMSADDAGWTPLHYAALLSPPTLISYLMTHGCSPFALTRRNLTSLDIVTAHSILPGRGDVALLLEEAMRGEGWIGGRMEVKRRLLDKHMQRKRKWKHIQDDVTRVLGVNPRWWGSDSDSLSTDSDSTGEDDEDDEVFTPPADFSSMLAYSPPVLPHIFDSLITNFPPSLRNAQPANVLYMLARFACLTCDHTWLEDLIIGATDAIEETFFNRGDDVTCLVFWLYNTTLWLHLLQCDNSINEACEMLGSFELIEEVINSVFVFIIRLAERKIDQLLDSAVLEYTPLASEFEAVQFESEWSFLRPFTSKKKASSSNLSKASPLRSGTPASPTTPGRPPSPSMSQVSVPTAAPKPFSSLRHSFSRTHATSTTPLQTLFSDSSSASSPNQLLSFLTALHTLLVVSGINPVFITQLWSQIMYWTSCEIFNRILTRKKYLCRSRAIQIGINLSVLEDWIEQMDLPRGVEAHFVPVKDLLAWLQRLSSITDFSDLVATIQSMKSINPLQMRRAVRDYKYEVNESRMTEECVQYLTQLQKDWERHRVKLGVEALRKEIDERDRDRESVSSFANDGPNVSRPTPSISSASTNSSSQNTIDILFDRTQEKSAWEPMRPPQVLGELLDSRYMLPLLFPSDPRLLAAFPARAPSHEESKDDQLRDFTQSRSNSRATARSSRAMGWRWKNRKIREVGIDTLKWIDGVRSAVGWQQPIDTDDEGQPPSFSSDDPHPHEDTMGTNTHITPLTRKPSGRSKGRPSASGGEITPVE